MPGTSDKECDTSAAQMKKLDFDNDTSEYICEKSTKKLNFVMAKATSKRYTLDYSCKCPYTFPHSYG